MRWMHRPDTIEHYKMNCKNNEQLNELLLSACRNEHIDFKLENVLNNITCIDVFYDFIKDKPFL